MMMNGGTMPTRTVGDTRQAATLPGPRCRALAEDERLFIGLVRHIVVHGLSAPVTRGAWSRRQAAGGAAAFASLGHWLTLLAAAATRQIAVGAPTHCCPSPDEIKMLAIVGGAPRGEFALVHALLCELVAVEAVDGLAHAAEQLGEDLMAAGIMLQPVRFKTRGEA